MSAGALATTRIGREGNGSAAAHGAVLYQHAFKIGDAARHTHARQEGGGGGAGNDQRRTATGRRLESIGVRSYGHGVHGIWRPAGNRVAALRQGGPSLKAADGDDSATLQVEFLAFFGVGIDGHFGRAGTNGIYNTALDVEIAIGIECIVIGRLPVNIAARDCVFIACQYLSVIYYIWWFRIGNNPGPK